MNPLLKLITTGAVVGIVNRFGQVRHGRAVMRAASAAGPGAWVLNMGGRYGTPGIATSDNVVTVSPVKVPAREPFNKWEFRRARWAAYKASQRREGGAD